MRYSLIGLGVSLIAALLWVITFDPHGGGEYSRFLFPIGTAVELMYYRNEPFPVILFYSMPLINWFLPGIIIDLIRHGRKNRILAGR